MLNTLFKTENIKYIISVDDCFAAPEEEQLRNELLVDSMHSFDNVASFFKKHGTPTHPTHRGLSQKSGLGHATTSREHFQAAEKVVF